MSRFLKPPQTVLFLGHFDDNKNADVLIRAMGRVVHRFPRAKCYFGADGDIDNGIALAEKVGAQEACVFLGWVGPEKKQELLDTCSVYCLPSKSEAMPMGLLEAMANGLVALVTPVGGMLDIVDNGRTGIYVSVGDSEELAHSIEALFDDVERANELAAAGMRSVRKSYDIERVVDRLASVYVKLGASHRSDGKR